MDLLTLLQSGNIDPNQLAQILTNKQPPVNLPTLNYTPPTSSDIDAKWKEFLDRAAKDPDLINYYNNKLKLAQGNTQIAIQYLDKDYQLGTRHTQENLGAAMQKFGLQFPQEQEALAGDLNKRGIAMTDLGGGQVGYAAGGQPQTELQRLSEDQRLRKEAEQRTARQSMDTLGLSKEKGQVQAGQALQQTQLDLQKQKEGDIENRAQSYMGIYNQKQQADYNKALIEQQNKMSGISGDSRGLEPTSPGTNVNERQGNWRWTGKEWQ